METSVYYLLITRPEDQSDGICQEAHHVPISPGFPQAQSEAELYSEPFSSLDTCSEHRRVSSVERHVFSRVLSPVYLRQHNPP